MDTYAKIPQNVHRHKMDAILQEAEKAANLFVNCRYQSSLWSLMQENFEQQNEFHRMRATYTRIDQETLDLTNLCHLLRNARDSPVTIFGSSSVYNKDTWDAPIADIQSKFQCLQNFLCKKSNSKNLENGNDFKVIFSLSEDKDVNSHIASYVQLTKTNQIQDALLSANQNENGIEDVLSVLKLAFPSLNCTDYSFVLYLGLLKEKRNSLTHARDGDISMAMHRKQFDVINQCIQNILSLLKNEANSPADIETYQSEIAKNIENILAGVDVNGPEMRSPAVPSNQISTIQNTLQALQNTPQALQRLKTNHSASASSNVFCNVCNIDLPPADQENHFKGKPHKNKQKAQSSSSQILATTSKTTSSNSSPVLLENNSTKISSSEVLIDTLGQSHKKELEKLKNKDCVPKTAADVVQRSKSVVEKVQNKSGSSGDDDLYCNVCDKHFSGVSSKREHDASEKHRKKMSQSSVGSGTTPKPNFVPTESDKKKALQNVVNVFYQSFDPFPHASLLLKNREVFSKADVETIRSQTTRVEKTDEFLRLIQLKLNWFEPLLKVLEDTDHHDLVHLLKNELDKLTIDKN